MSQASMEISRISLSLRSLQETNRTIVALGGAASDETDPTDVDEKAALLRIRPREAADNAPRNRWVEDLTGAMFEVLAQRLS